MKDRRKHHIEALAKQILEKGFLFPLFVWRQPGTTQHIILDGHARMQALLCIQKKKYHIPDIPVVLVDADSEIQAKQKILEVNAMHGIIDPSVFRGFAEGLPLDLSVLKVPFVEFEPPVQDPGFFPDTHSVPTCTCPYCKKETPITR